MTTATRPDIATITQTTYMGRGDAESEPGRPNWAIISIHDRRLGPANLQQGWKHVFRLSFYDRELPVLGLQTFSREQAKSTLAFIENVAPTVEGILVHCHAGLSRSPAVAKFIAQKYDLEFDHKSAPYNRLVHSMLREADRR